MSDDETGDAEEASSSSVTASAARTSRTSSRSWWHEHKGGIAAALVAAVVAGWVSPAGHWVGRAGDDVRDHLRSIDGERFDTLKERIDTRPFWQGKPEILDKSLEVLRQTEELDREPFESPATVDGVKPRVVLADRLLSDVVSYNGKPVILVGRVKSTETVGEEITALGTQEVTITGKDRRRPLVLGIGGSTTLDAEVGDVVGVTGLLLAYGRLRAADDPVGPTTGYFYVLNVLDGLDLDDRLSDRSCE